MEAGLWTPVLSGVAIAPELRWKRNLIPYIDSFGTLFNLESMHEWEVANLLDKHSVTWSRPIPFRLSDGRTYQPDFYLNDYDVYIDPKAKWKGSDGRTYQRYHLQQSQIEKIKQFESEYQTRCVILWADDKRSHTIDGIIEQITAGGEIGETQGI